MKKLDFMQMEVINGGLSVNGASADFDSTSDDLTKKQQCALALATAGVIGTGGLIVTAATGGTAAAIFWAMGTNWAGWIVAGITSC
jgi:hypothetical protein